MVWTETQAPGRDPLSVEGIRTRSTKAKNHAELKMGIDWETSIQPATWLSALQLSLISSCQVRALASQNRKICIHPSMRTIDR